MVEFPGPLVPAPVNPVDEPPFWKVMVPLAGAMLAVTPAANAVLSVNCGITITQVCAAGCSSAGKPVSVQLVLLLVAVREGMFKVTTPLLTLQMTLAVGDVVQPVSVAVKFPVALPAL